MRMPASNFGAYYYICSICFVRYEASPKRLTVPRTAGDSHSSVTLASCALSVESSFH